jgi:hypothetical protein
VTLTTDQVVGSKSETESKCKPEAENLETNFGKIAFL